MSERRSGFEVSVSARGDGTIEAVYIRLSQRKVAHTKELEIDTVLADFDSRGRLVGIELLGPAKLSTLARLVDEARRKPFRKVVRTAVPHELVYP